MSSESKEIHARVACLMRTLLKIVLGHSGKVLLLKFDHIDRFYSHMWRGRQVQRGWMTVGNKNIKTATSRMFHLGPLRYCLKTRRPDKIMSSPDHLFEDPKVVANFMEEVEKSGLASAEYLRWYTQAMLRSCFASESNLRMFSLPR